MLLSTFDKQPSDTLDYNIDYSEWIEDDDAPASATVSVTGTGLEHENTEILGKVVRVWLSAGDDGTTYTVTVTTTTVFGRVRQDEFKIKVKEV
jgi:hypothetical protein